MASNKPQMTSKYLNGYIFTMTDEGLKFVDHLGTVGPQISDELIFFWMPQNNPRFPPNAPHMDVWKMTLGEPKILEWPPWN